MSRKGLMNDSVACHTTIFLKLLNDSQYQKLECRHEREHISIQGSIKSYYSLQVLLTAIIQLRSRQPNKTFHVNVTIGSEQNLFEIYFSKREPTHDHQLP